VRGSRNAFDVAQAETERTLIDGDVIMQPYLRSVEDLGERSLVFVDGELTHAVRRPAAHAPGGEHEELLELVLLTEEERSVARSALQALGEPALYARVDLVRDDLGLARLLELELIEPALFFGLAPHAAERMARAISARLRRLGLWVLH
jgi:hypothetical protein